MIFFFQFERKEILRRQNMIFIKCNRKKETVLKPSLYYGITLSLLLKIYQWHQI